MRVRAGHMLGKCFAKEQWHMEAIGEYKDAIHAIDATEKERELAIRYDLMLSLIEEARKERSVDLARLIAIVAEEVLAASRRPTVSSGTDKGSRAGSNRTTSP